MTDLAEKYASNQRIPCWSTYSSLVKAHPASKELCDVILECVDEIVEGEGLNPEEIQVQFHINPFQGSGYTTGEIINGFHKRPEKPARDYVVCFYMGHLLLAFKEGAWEYDHLEHLLPKKRDGAVGLRWIVVHEMAHVIDHQEQGFITPGDDHAERFQGFFKPLIAKYIGE